ncbi:hypothetical protein [Streptomyces sp. SudanB182_2057]|uniref:hypothetical protein n=1 Tax=Streptomyces sp. SudanB182_2057 TaxID=3035281 RepID=UPI003F56E075
MTGFLSPLDSPAARRSWLAGLRDSIPKAASKNDLLDQIDGALFVAAPQGDPATLNALGKRYRGQVDKAGDLHDRVNKVARKGLPEVWTGRTSVLASDGVAAAARAATEMAEAFDGGAKALAALADALGHAKRQDADGRARLDQARRQLGPREGFFDVVDRMIETDEEKQALAAARSVATEGVDLMHKAAVAADDAVRAATRDLNKWAAEARAGKLRTGGLSAVDRLMLADTSGKAGAAEYNEILTAGDLERSGRAMDRLPAADRARMDRLLAGAGSPQEKAYLMKALAAGHSVDDIETFGGKIHGKDPAWLQEHLSPIVTQGDSLKDEGVDAGSGANVNTDLQSFRGQQWAQGGDGREGTCVASSPSPPAPWSTPSTPSRSPAAPAARRTTPPPSAAAWWTNSTGCTPRATAAPIGTAWSWRARPRSSTRRSAPRPEAPTSSTRSATRTPGATSCRR